MVKNIGVYILFILLTLILVPTLAVLSFGLYLSAFIVLIAGLLRTIGLSTIQMNIWPGIEIPQLLSLPISVIFAGIFALIAYKSWVYLKNFLHLIQANR